MQTRLLQRVFIPAAVLFLSTSLIACGGGGGGSTPATGTPGTTAPTATPCPSGYTGTAPACVAPATTTATGKLVDDASNAPLAGIPVKIEPWAPCVSPAPTTTYGNDGCPTPLPSPQTTTAADGSFSLGGVANGHYILIVGSDSPTDTTRPTIHDNVTFTGGAQTLKAPTLPPIPTITPPAAELSGNYRLTTIDQTNELPCFTDFNQQRASHSLPPVVVDEWLTENAREANAYRASGQFVPGQPWPGNLNGYLTTGNVTSSGGTACAQMILGAFANTALTYSMDPRTQWLAATWYQYQSGTQSTGIAEFPIDPRAVTDLNVPNWP